MRIGQFFTLGLSSALVIFSSSCRKKSGACEDGFFGLDRIVQPNVQQTPQAVGQPQDLDDGLNCTVQTYKWSPSVEEFLLLNPHDAIYPGAILGANSLTDGSFSSIGGERAPIDLSITLQGVNQTKITAPSGKLSDVNQAITDLLNQQLTGSEPAKYEYSEERVHSTEYLMAHVGASASGGWGEVNASFDYENTEQFTKYLVNFKQVYYTVNIDRPDDPSDFWVECPDESVFNGDVPVYVSSVKYGRMGLLMIESSLSSTTIEAHLDAAFSIATTDVAVDADFRMEQLLENSNIDIKIIGGNSTSAIQSINGIDAFRDYILNGAEYSIDSRGEPLAYTLKFIDDNSTARIITATEYDVRECEVLEQNQLLVDLDPILDQICPLYFHQSGGDNKMGSGDNVDFDFSCRLEINVQDESQLHAVLDVSADEVNNSGGYDPTAGEITGVKKVVYTAPAGYRIIEINSDQELNNFHGRFNGEVSAVVVKYNEDGAPAAQSVNPDAVTGVIGSGLSVDKLSILSNPNGSDNQFSTGSCTTTNVHVKDIFFKPVVVTLEEL